MKTPTDEMAELPIGKALVARGADRERRRIRRAQLAAMENLRHIVWCKSCDSHQKLGEAIAGLDSATRAPKRRRTP